MRVYVLYTRLAVPALLSIVLIGASAAQNNSGTKVGAPAATTFTSIADFGNGNGEYPNPPLAQGLDGNVYGTTQLGPWPTNGFGFKMTPTGVFSLFDYSCTANYCTGEKPYTGLVLATDGNFYGTTYEGGDGAYRYSHYGSYYGGTIVQLNPQGGLSTIYSFCSLVACDDGDDPYYLSPLIQGSDGNLYGVTYSGGLYNLGTVFSVTTGGTLTTLHSFASTEGNSPGGGLVQATDGNYYGTTQSGGSGANCTYDGGCGTIFKITAEGTLTTIYNFCEQLNCTDGYLPRGSLIQAADGNLYGITFYGGTYKTDSPTYGTVFKITTAGELTTLYNFCSLADCADGYPPTGIMQATDGHFYGATYWGGGSYAVGTLFKLTSAGVLTTLHTFCPKGGTHCADGTMPAAPMEATDGNFYGVTGEGGLNNHGIAYKLSAGLPEFVEAVNASGAVGSSVIILGTNMTGASSVTFNGIKATFTQVSKTEITATVPNGASTGPIVVTTPKAILTSNKKFQVTP